MIWVYLENVFQQRGGESLASIKDVARQAGVAISTVSKVLNGYEGVSASTKDKVNAAIEALNYTPNAVAAALSSKQFGRVALLLKLEETVGCEDENNLTKPYVLHAEANAITKIARSNNSSDGATMYVTASPCIECAKLIIQAGIKRVVYSEHYRLEDGIELLKRAGIEVIYTELNEDSSPNK